MREVRQLLPEGHNQVSPTLKKLTKKSKFVGNESFYGNNRDPPEVASVY